jgi:2'-5' RNA ligase
MRLFIAAMVDQECTGRLLALQERLRAAACRGNFPRGFHLTLVFLGETGEGLVPAIRDRIAALPCSGAFTLHFSRAGCFRRRGKELWYIGAAPGSPGMERLLELRAKLVEGLEELAPPRSASLGVPAGAGGLSFDRRPLKAHITLGRELRLNREVPPFPVQVEVPIRRISLMQSEHRDGRRVYTERFGRDV